MEKLSSLKPRALFLTTVVRCGTTTSGHGHGLMFRLNDLGALSSLSYSMNLFISVNLQTWLNCTFNCVKEKWQWGELIWRELLLDLQLHCGKECKQDNVKTMSCPLPMVQVTVGKAEWKFLADVCLLCKAEICHKYRALSALDPSKHTARFNNKNLLADDKRTEWKQRQSVPLRWPFCWWCFTTELSL